MTTYALSKEAHQDLKEVTWYTLNKWGREEAEKYITGLQNIFEGIGSGNVIKKLFNDWYPEILVAKYRYHFVFYLTEDVEKPI